MGRFEGSIVRMPSLPVIYVIRDPKSRSIIYLGKGSHLSRAASQDKQHYPDATLDYVLVSDDIVRTCTIPNAVATAYDFVGNLERLLHALCFWHTGALPQDVDLPSDGNQTGGFFDSFASLSAVNELLGDIGISSNRGCPDVPQCFPQMLRPIPGAGPGAPQTRPAFPTFWVDKDTKEAFFDFCPLLTSGKNIQYDSCRGYAGKKNWPI